MYMHISLGDAIDMLFGEDEARVCMLCNTHTHTPACPRCLESWSLVTVDEWEDMQCGVDHTEDVP